MLKVWQKYIIYEICFVPVKIENMEEQLCSSSFKIVINFHNNFFWEVVWAWDSLCIWHDYFFVTKCWNAYKVNLCLCEVDVFMTSYNVTSNSENDYILQYKKIQIVKYSALKLYFLFYWWLFKVQYFFCESDWVNQF